MWWQSCHSVDDCGGLGAQRGCGALGEHAQGGVLGGGEVDVLTGEAADERQLQHLSGPLRAERRVAEYLTEWLVERAFSAPHQPAFAQRCG
jgi:hypothetical protein